MKMAMQPKIRTGFAVAIACLLLAGAAACWNASRTTDALHQIQRAYEAHGVYLQSNGPPSWSLSLQAATISTVVLAVGGIGCILAAVFMGFASARARGDLEKRQQEEETSRNKQQTLAAHESERLRAFNEELEQQVRQRTAELRESNERLKKVLEVETVGVMFWDLTSGAMIDANDTFLKTMGYSRQNVEARELTWQKLTPPEYMDVSRQEMEKFARTGRVGPYEKEYFRKDGSRQWFVFAGSSLGNDTCVEFCVDISARKEAEKRLRHAQRLESLGTLAGGIAHDMNNALAPILMSLEMLREDHPDDAGMLDIVHASATHAAGMVRQLLTFAKGAEGARVSLQITHLVKEMQVMIKNTFPKNIELEVRLAPGLPTVLGDATQLHQVLLNLCVNARDAMPDGGRLVLEAERREVDAVFAASVVGAKIGTYAVMRVRDTGTGIPPKVLERIFEPFFTTKGPEKGTGLGLSNSLGIVKGHGGFIQVYSEPGKGSTFAVYLPVEDHGNNAKQTTLPASKFHGNGEKVLLVDDQSAVRDIGLAVLQKLNFSPLTACDGAEGIVIAAEYRAHLSAVLMDMQMPHMDGLTLARALRRMQPGLPMVAMSGRFEEATKAELESLGVTLYLPKPFTEIELASVLEKLFASAKLQC